MCPLLQAAGGLLLIWIAYKLVTPHGHDEANVRQSADTLMQAIQTIIVADAVMSLDNMLAVGAAAEGHLWLLLFGLGLSIPILLFGSALIAQLFGRYPILMWVGVIILLHTAVHMFFGDPYVEDLFGHAARRSSGSSRSRSRSPSTRWSGIATAGGRRPARSVPTP